MADLVVRDLTVEYDSGGYPIRPLNQLSITAVDGELVVLLGPSGCGKTTLLSCLAGLLTPTEGTVTLGDISLDNLSPKQLADYRRRHVGVVFQAFNLIPSLTALGNVVAPMSLAGVRRHEARSRATDLLARVGLEDRMHHRPSKMSGGQQQRVAIARALVHDPRLVLADEPTAHLDHIQVEGVLRLIRELATPGRIVVVATHDDRITHLADRVVELVPTGAVAEREPEDVVLADGQVLFQQGDLGELVYIVRSGSLEIYRELSDGGEESVNVIGPGHYFGELAPLLRLPRSASVRAVGDAVVSGYTPRRFRLEHPERPLGAS